ncbi:GNAT family N-acetyltransferase [Clostridium sp. Marseille-QA1073]
MAEKILNQYVILKEYISEKDYKEISQLEEICNLNDKSNLKLELDYRLNMPRSSDIGLKNVNEFLYYVDKTLVSYINISSFGGNISEIIGMTHPDWRRKGLFKKLFKLVIDQCQNRNFNKILLLSNGKSNSGIEFIKSIGGNYDFSEYRMKRSDKTPIGMENSITLRKSNKLDAKEIQKQNTIFFNLDRDDIENFIDNDNIVTYMIELNGDIIGKIRIECNDTSSYVAGFGILPDFRGKGCGKAALKEALRLINEKNIYDIELDVETKNANALTLYKACGFEEKSIMNYYEYNIES